MVEMLVQTDSRRTIYIEQMSGWYDYDTTMFNAINSGNQTTDSSSKQEIIGLTCFSLLQQTVGSYGLVGLDLDIVPYRYIVESICQAVCETDARFSEEAHSIV